ncbi:MAG: DUF1858 domain-containing protein [Bacteroidetes bacterium HGW-Bacteroidetes-15]|nr:MAG: DUF1858 domain-containing protein [Bacteroidetes bacterium HGW-Bacteroidetes-15]
MITKDILVEDLVEQLPDSVAFLRERGLVCILCGEPVWGTLYELAKSKSFTDEEIDSIVDKLTKMEGT